MIACASCATRPALPMTIAVRERSSYSAPKQVTASAMMSSPQPVFRAFEVLDAPDRGGRAGAQACRRNSSVASGSRGRDRRRCMFTHKLAELTAETVRYRFGETILEILSDGRKVTGVRTSSGRIEADAVVVALSSYSPAW